MRLVQLNNAPCAALDPPGTIISVCLTQSSFISDIASACEVSNAISTGGSIQTQAEGTFIDISRTYRIRIPSWTHTVKATQLIQTGRTI